MNASKYRRLKRHQAMRKTYRALLPHRDALAADGLLLLSPRMFRTFRRAAAAREGQ